MTSTETSARRYREALHEHFRRLLCDRERAARAGDWETFRRIAAEIEEIRAQKVRLDRARNL